MSVSAMYRRANIRCVVPIVAAILLLGCCVWAPAQPRTLYRPADIENARESIERYEWARSIVAGWERSVEYAMQQDREFFEALIPDLTPGIHYGQTCPACVDPVLRRGERNVGWSVTAPDQLTCRDCGTVYPNEEYPETGILECPRMGQTFTYYQTPEERALGPDATIEQRREHAIIGLSHRPANISMSGLIRFYRAQWAWRQVIALARMYALTDDVAYAERVVWILDRFARVYPNYLYQSYDGSYADWPPAEVAESMGDPSTPRGGRFPPDAIRHPYELNRHSDEQGEYSTLHNGFWGAGRLNQHGSGSDSDPLFNFTVAYDLVRDARYDDGTPLVDAETDRRIVEDLIDAGCTDMDHWDDLSNKGVATRSLSAAVGLLLDQPERVRRGLDGFHAILEERYHFDGFYSESPAYARHNYLVMADLPDLLHGYSDPPGYDPPGGERVEDFRPFEVGHFNLALLAMVRMPAPGNLKPVIGNTTPGTVLAPRYAEVLAARLGGPYPGLLRASTGRSLSDYGTAYSLWYRSPDLQVQEQMSPPVRSEWFPGWHVAVLRGDDPDRTALYLVGNEHRWTLRTGHRHADLLNLSLYAFGEELASDRGYFSGSGHRTPDGRVGQSWTGGTLSHNLVVVDEENQSGAPRGSNLELFGLAPGVEVVQASGFGVYEQCDEYRRTSALLRTPGGSPYVVDFFRVAGGETHQYTFHCNGSLVGIAPADPAPEPVELSATWAHWLDNPRAVTPDEPRRFTWEHNDVRLDLMLLNRSDTVQQVIVGDAPGWRRHTEAVRGVEPIHQILAENRTADDGALLATRYAAVMAPYEGDASEVLSAELIADDAESGAMAVEVRFAGRTDYVISAKDAQRRQFGPVTVAGEFAWVSVDDEGRVLGAYLLAGTELAFGDTRLELPEATTTLRVASVEDRTFHLAEPLPADLTANAWFALAEGPEPMTPDSPRPRTGFEIESADTESITVRDYPVLDCDEVTILHAAWLAASG